MSSYFNTVAISCHILVRKHFNLSFKIKYFKFFNFCKIKMSPYGNITNF